MNNSALERIKEECESLSLQKVKIEQEDWDYPDKSDEAYYQGQIDGETFLARKILRIIESYSRENKK
jgi:hypothetical protein